MYHIRSTADLGDDAGLVPRYSPPRRDWWDGAAPNFRYVPALQRKGGGGFRGSGLGLRVQDLCEAARAFGPSSSAGVNVRYETQ